MTDNPLETNPSVTSLLATLVGDNQYLFVASVCKGWHAAWGQRPAATRAVTAHSSVSQLVYGFETGLRKSAKVPEAAARLGRLDLLMCAHANGCELGQTCSLAAFMGHLGIVWWARTAAGAALTEETAAHAAKGRNLSVLKWLVGEGCPWNEGAAQFLHYEDRRFYTEFCFE